jgi:hypothetical protein
VVERCGGFREYEANAKCRLCCGRVWGRPREIQYPETALRGKRICVTGKIGDYHGKAEIVLTDPSQLTQ